VSVERREKEKGERKRGKGFSPLIQDPFNLSLFDF
jgi:hypothetical protein